MEGKEAVDICLTLIKYITPLAALVWAIAHKDAQIKQNTSDIKKMKDNLVKDFAALQKVTIHDDKLKKIEKERKGKINFKKVRIIFQNLLTTDDRCVILLG